MQQHDIMRTMIPTLMTPRGRLYEADCVDFLSKVESESVDLVFADPPFNLGKSYTSKINDSREVADYLSWCREWLDLSIAALKPGGSLFLWNLPKWNLALGEFLNNRLTFRHWISVDIKYSLPIAGRLYPSHYSLLYYTKGKRPAIFHPDRLPVPCCKHCGGELRDYGGYKDKMNPRGVNLSDVWTDIPPVRHAKYKKRDANALSLKLMDRIVCMASERESLILDPFGGSGTTYVAAELNGRNWIGCELDSSSIIGRFEDLDADREHLEQIHASKNVLFTADNIAKRRRSGRPLSPNYRLSEIPGLSECECPVPGKKQEELFG
jgi:site-specific DNA-methyltransferase (adenine-specific)